MFYYNVITAYHGVLIFCQVLFSQLLCKMVKEQGHCEVEQVTNYKATHELSLIT